MFKITDTNENVSIGGRVYKYWEGKPIKNPKSYRGNAYTHDAISITGICKRFKIKAFEFGNYMTVNDRYDKLMGLVEEFDNFFCNIIKTTNVGMDYMLSIAFGARGMGGNASAHFEPHSQIINITKQYNCTFAHEYGHAIDYIFGLYIDPNKDYAASSGGWTTTAQLDEKGGIFRTQINDIVNVANKCSRAKNWLVKGGYWARRTEVFARMFEEYVAYRANGYNHLVMCNDFARYANAGFFYCDKDYFIAKLVPRFDKLMRAFGKECNKK